MSRHTNSFLPCFPCLHLNTLWTEWQMQDSRSISFSRCSGDGSDCVDQVVLPAFLSYLSFSAGFCKSVLLQVNPGIIEMQAAWSESESHQDRNILVPIANVHVQIFNFGFSGIFSGMFAGQWSWDANSITESHVIQYS